LTLAEPFPWAEAMQIGLGLLRLPPKDFWAMTPRELAAAIAGLAGPPRPEPLGPQDLATLMQRYPDDVR
jgi:uncharacterized phage protein (TIGR02216 family)